MKLHDVVATLDDLPEAHLAKGQVGTIVDALDGTSVLVEFADIDGVAYAIEPLNPETQKEIRRIGEIPGPSFALTPEE